MDRHMDQDSEDLANTPSTSAIKTEMLEDVHEELYASIVKTELLEDDQQDPCLSAVKSEATEDAPQEFYFCAVEMDGLEDAEFREQTQYDQLKQERLMRKRQRAAERQRRYKARQKVYAEAIKRMIASSKKKCNEHSQKEFHCAESQTQEDSQMGWANDILNEQIEKRMMKRKRDAERQRRFRQYRKAREIKDEDLQAMMTSANENSLADITHLSKSAVKSEVSANIDDSKSQSKEDSQKDPSLNREEQELNKLIQKRKRDAERQRRYRDAKKLRKKIANTDSLSQSSTDKPQRFCITQIKLGNVCRQSKNDVRSDEERFYIKQIKLGNVCDQSKNIVQSDEERENNARLNLLNFIAAQASNAPNQAFARQSESDTAQEGLAADVKVERT